MPASLLLLLHFGVMPALAVVPDAALGSQREPRIAESLHLDLDLEARRPSGLDDLARELGAGVALGALRVGIDGQPPPPFLSNFLHAHEIRVTRVDPESVVSSVLVQIRVTLE